MDKIVELKLKLAADRKRMSEQDGCVILSGDTGPVGFALIESVIAVLEAQEVTIGRLEQRIAKLERDQVS